MCVGGYCAFLGGSGWFPRGDSRHTKVKFDLRKFTQEMFSCSEDFILLSRIVPKKLWERSTMAVWEGREGREAV